MTMAKRAAEAPDPADDPAVPNNYSLSCRVCGAAITFHDPPEDGAVTCPECGKINLVPEEWLEEGGV
jgi:hypothetical protein